MTGKRGADLRYGLRPSLRTPPRETSIRGSIVLSPGSPLHYNHYNHYNQGGQLNEAAARRGTVIEAARSIKTASAEG